MLKPPPPPPNFWPIDQTAPAPISGAWARCYMPRTNQWELIFIATVSPEETVPIPPAPKDEPASGKAGKSGGGINQPLSDRPPAG